MKPPHLTFVLGMFLLASCQTSPPSGADYLIGLGGAAPQAPPSLGVGEQVSYWDDDGSQGPPRIVVDLNHQVARFYRGNTVIGVAVRAGTVGWFWLPR